MCTVTPYGCNLIAKTVYLKRAAVFMPHKNQASLLQLSHSELDDRCSQNNRLLTYKESFWAFYVKVISIHLVVLK